MRFRFDVELILAFLVLAALAAVWYWWTQPSYYAPLPSPYCDRESQEPAWHDRYDGDRTFQDADAVLLLLCDAFCFDPVERYRFSPDDRIMDVYRARYPPKAKWPKGDCMEIETLIWTVGQKFGVQTGEWQKDMTFAHVVSLAAKKRRSDSACSKEGSHGAR
jgi:hypothetical protein